MLPNDGVSSYSAKGGDLRDTDSDKALQKAVQEMLPKNIELIEMDSNAEDDDFVAKAVDTLVGLIEKSK